MFGILKKTISTRQFINVQTSQRIYYLNLKASNNIILNSKTAPVIKSNRVQEFKLIEVN